MEATSVENLSWEQKIYWSHFHTIHFSQFLVANFKDQLYIPDKFIHNLNHQLPEIVTLRGPSGVSWSVGLVTFGKTLAFKHGWQEFLDDNSLSENDFLIFKYDAKSHFFDVLMFDALSLCEKEAAYFVTEPGHEKRLIHPKMKEISTWSVFTSPSNGAGSSSSFDLNFTTPPKQKNSFLPATGTLVKKKGQCKSLPAVRTRWSSRDRNLTPKAMALYKYDDIDFSGLYPKKKVYAKQYLSSRRLVTEEEKTRTLVAARAAARVNDGVAVIMRPTSVYKKFFAVIPIDWLRRNVPLHKQDVIVRGGSKAWYTKFYYVKSRACGGLTGGWRHFAVENNLEEFDVCVCKKDPEFENPIVLDVTIFRVVPEVTPLREMF